MFSLYAVMPMSSIYILSALNTLNFLKADHSCPLLSVD